MTSGDELLRDLMALPLDAFIDVIDEICNTAGIPPDQCFAFRSALMLRLKPDKPLTASEVLAKTLFTQKRKEGA